MGECLKILSCFVNERINFNRFQVIILCVFLSFDIRFEVVATILEQKSGGAHRRGISTRLDDGEGQFQWWQNN